MVFCVVKRAVELEVVESILDEELAGVVDDALVKPEDVEEELVAFGVVDDGLELDVVGSGPESALVDVADDCWDKLADVDRTNAGFKMVANASKMKASFILK